MDQIATRDQAAAQPHQAALIPKWSPVVRYGVTGVPAFSPHDLRHRRISLLHLGGVPWARIGEHVGQRNLAVTANTYSDILTDEAELNYSELIENARMVQTPVQTSPLENVD
jgi:integrase